MSKRIIYRVTLGPSTEERQFVVNQSTLADFEKFVSDAHEFGISSTAIVTREPQGDQMRDYFPNGGPLMVERVVEPDKAPS
jgi:hypothetical protein